MNMINQQISTISTNNNCNDSVMDTYITDKELHNLYNNKNTNFAKIRNILENDSVSQAYRIFVLYPDETINYELTQYYLISGGSYNENYQNGQRRSLSFSLVNENGRYTPNINTLWAGTRLKFEVGITLSSGQTIWFDKGVYIIQSVSPSLTSNQKIVNISASDKFSIFEGAGGLLGETYCIEPGQNIEDIIQDILLKDNGSGYPFDAKPIIYNNTLKGRKTQASIIENSGGTLAHILLELATQLSAELYYNASGNLVISPLSEEAFDANKPLLWDYSTDEGTISGLNFNIDYNSIINQVMVVGGTANDSSTCTAIASNNDPNSPLCCQRIGNRLGPIIRDNNITKKYLAKERADYELRQYLLIKSSTSATVAFNPVLEVNNLITISDSFFNLKHNRFLLQSVSFGLSYDGQMSISFSNLQNLPFVNG